MFHISVAEIADAAEIAEISNTAEIADAAEITEIAEVANTAEVAGTAEIADAADAANHAGSPGSHLKRHNLPDASELVFYFIALHYVLARVLCVENPLNSASGRYELRDSSASQRYNCAELLHHAYIVYTFEAG